MNSWPFDQPKNCAVFTTTHVMKEGRDIAFVFHDADDHGWQFHYDGEKRPGDSMVVSLSTIVQHDPTVLDVADIPPGWKAWRKKRGDAWQRAENPREEEGDPAGTDNDRAAPDRV
jgi:hypothetical protein